MFLVQGRAFHVLRLDHAVVLVDPDGAEPGFLRSARGVRAVQLVDVPCELQVRVPHDFEVLDAEVYNNIRVLRVL